MDTLILIALQEEAPALVNYDMVYFTGVGKVNAAITAASLIEKLKPSRIINFGTAGGITVTSGLHRVGKFVQRDMLSTALGNVVGQTPFDDTPVILDLGDGLTCSTGDNFVTDSDLQIPADVVDMEAYAIAKACKLADVEFICYKYISDMANDDSKTDWNTNVSYGQKLYMDKLTELNIKIS
jgi:adenosylhomocysteine nucleosidase